MSTNSLTAKNILLFLLCLILIYHFYNKTQNTINPNTDINIPSIVIPQPQPEPPPLVQNSCDISLTEAFRADKNLIIIFTAEWCGFCKTLKKDLSELINHDKYVVCLVDVDNQLNKEICQHFNIKMLPTSIIISPKKNKELKRITGYDKQNYIVWLK